MSFQTVWRKVCVISLILSIWSLVLSINRQQCTSLYLVSAMKYYDVCSVILHISFYLSNPLHLLYIFPCHCGPPVCVSNEILRCLSCYSWPPHVYPCPHKTSPLRHSKNTKLSAPFKHVLKKFLFLFFSFESITFNISIKSPHSIIPKTQRHPSHFKVLRIAPLISLTGDKDNFQQNHSFILTF